MADEDGWVGLTWNTPLMYDQNFALAGFDRTHVLQMGFVYELPWLRESKDGGTNTALNCQGCGSTFIDVKSDPAATGSVGSSTEPYYPLEIFSQPSGVNVAGFGNSGRNRFRRPPVWNLDLSLFKRFEIGRLRPEFRIESVNILNHPNWGAPVTNFTANNFMRFTPGNVESGTNTPGARRIQLALRLPF